MRYQILDQQGMNFITFTVVDWIDLFTRKVYADLLVDSLAFCQKERGLKVYAYVIMPSHVHMIVQTDWPKGLSNVIQRFKSYTASQALKYIKDKRKIESRRDWLLHHFAFHAKRNQSHSNYQVWQKGQNHPFALWSPWMIRQKLFYIHRNPVKAGIVKIAEHYWYSSAQDYSGSKGPLEVTLLDDIWNDIGFVNLGI